MTSRNPHESPDLEGLPDDVEDSPPGKDVELDEEGVMLPRDRPVAAGPGRAYPVTAAEQARPESPSARHTREEPDFGEPGSPGETASAGDTGSPILATGPGQPEAPVGPAGPEGEPTGAAGEAAAEEAAMEVVSEDDLPAGDEPAD